MEDKSNITLLKFVRKADTSAVINSVFELEDEFNLAYTDSSGAGPLIIRPPFNPSTLMGLVNNNNTLNQCVETMEVNIDGTGFSIEPVDTSKSGDEKEKKRLEAFFNEPFPMIGFTKLRRQLRRDLESIGYGYIEVIRNLNGDILFLRRIEAKLVRMVKLDDPFLKTIELDREGEKVKAQIWARDRRFVQQVGIDLIYFKEFGAERELNRLTGYWEKEDNPLKPEERASELLCFTVNPDTETPYGVPRWINQLPSVLGSRKAEETNLDFFDAGAIPPAAIFVEGGALADSVIEQLRAYFGPKNKDPYRVAVVEVQSTSGTLENPGRVNVKVEKFGDANSRTGDSLFRDYDANCEMRVQSGFRLPAIFMGKAESITYANALTSFMVTELQVFQPERIEFDEIINRTIIREMGIKDWKLVSKPATLRNVDLQLQALGMGAEYIDGEAMIDELNEISGLHLEFSKEKQQDRDQQQQDQSQDQETTNTMPKNKLRQPVGGTVPEGNIETPNQDDLIKADSRVLAKKSEDFNSDDVVQLVALFVRAAGLTGKPSGNRQEILKKVGELTEFNQALFDKKFAEIMFSPANLYYKDYGCVA